MAKPLSVEESMKLTTAVETLNKVLRELHLTGHDYGVAVLGGEAIARPAVLTGQDTRSRQQRMTPPRVYVKLSESVVEVGREPI